DSGLDIFDHKLNAFKEYHKEILSVPRVTCNVEVSEELIKNLNIEIEEINSKIYEIENVKNPEILNNIKKGEDFLENLIKKLHRIDDEIYHLDVDKTNIDINTIKGKIDVLKEKEDRLVLSINSLKESYDEERLNELQQKKEEHKGNEYKLKILIKDKEREIINNEFEVGKINGEINRIKERGAELKANIFKLKNEKNCPTCGQLLDDDHQEHINKEVKSVEKEMFTLADAVEDKMNQIKPFE
ncbi:hypothetical protein KY321_04800, partial [Candidatus Woesearchaeota archaeon]|nr:hypothetical protein [Candidatus Woesearchaeota archaeon]